MRIAFGIVLMTAVGIGAVVDGARGAEDSAATRVAQLLAMPTAAEDPMGKLNAARWQLERDIAEMGDEAIGPLEDGLKRATTALQRQDVATALAEVTTAAGTRALLGLVSDEHEEVRAEALQTLEGRVGAAAEVGGSDGIVGRFAELLKTEKVELLRVWMCAALGRAAGHEAIADAAQAALRERLKNDGSAAVRFRAACELVDFGDNSGLGELKAAVLKLRAQGEKGSEFSLEQAAKAIANATGRDFGAVPMNPMVASDSRRVAALEAGRAALIGKLAAWAEEGDGAATQK